MELGCKFEGLGRFQADDVFLVSRTQSGIRTSSWQAKGETMGEFYACELKEISKLMKDRVNLKSYDFSDNLDANWIIMPISWNS